MNGLFGRVAVYTLAPMAAAVLGAAIAAFHPPNSRVRSYIQHFAAGVVFAVVAVELLPHVIRQHQPVPAALGFLSGTATMLLIRWLTRGSEETELGEGADGKIRAGLLVGMGVDLLIDGLLLGVAFAAGEKEGRLLALALAAEMLSLGLAAAATLGQVGQPRPRVILTVSGLALLLAAGAVSGATLLTAVPATWMDAILSFGLAALLFLVTEELLVEAHVEPETPLATSTFFFGFLIFMVLGMLE